MGLGTLGKGEEKEGKKKLGKTDVTKFEIETHDERIERLLKTRMGNRKEKVKEGVKNAQGSL